MRNFRLISLFSKMMKNVDRLNLTGLIVKDYKIAPAAFETLLPIEMRVVCSLLLLIFLYGILISQFIDKFSDLSYDGSRKMCTIFKNYLMWFMANIFIHLLEVHKISFLKNISQFEIKDIIILLLINLFKAKQPISVARL